MSYRSANFLAISTPVKDLPNERATLQRLGTGTGGATLVGLHLGPCGWIDLPADPKARYCVVVKGMVSFIDDTGAVEILLRGCTFAANAHQPLTLRTGDGADVFIVEMDSVSAPAPDVEERLAERRARLARAPAPAPADPGPVRTFWGRLAGRRDRKLG